jgi:hypothetical protein
VVVGVPIGLLLGGWFALGFGLFGWLESDPPDFWRVVVCGFRASCGSSDLVMKLLQYCATL